MEGHRPELQPLRSGGPQGHRRSGRPQRRRLRQLRPDARGGHRGDAEAGGAGYAGAAPADPGVRPAAEPSGRDYGEPGRREDFHHLQPVRVLRRGERRGPQGGLSHSGLRQRDAQQCGGLPGRGPHSGPHGPGPADAQQRAERPDPLQRPGHQRGHLHSAAQLRARQLPGQRGLR